MILVSSTQLADSLISPVHAKRLDSPILLSGKDFLDKSVLDELKRLNTSSVDIVGGENSIGENVVKELENNGIKVNRIAGEDRYKTSIKLAEQMYKDSKYDEVFVVDGTNIADGLSVANFSTKVNAPVILTSPEKIDFAFGYAKLAIILEVSYLFSPAILFVLNLFNEFSTFLLTEFVPPII